MKAGFILLGTKRLRLSAIKKYEPIVSATKAYGIRCFYSLSSKRDHDTFYFDNEKERDSVISVMDDAIEVTKVC